MYVLPADLENSFNNFVVNLSAPTGTWEQCVNCYSCTRRVVNLGETLQQLAGHLSGHSVRMGASDLAFRLYGALGADGYCDQGATYAGAPNAACGGHLNWGATEMEVWYPVP